MTDQPTDMQITGDGAMQRAVNPLATSISTSALKQRMGAIKECLTDLMQKDIHYGEIPGTGKPTMLKPGAEMICAMFQLDPQPDVEIEDLGDGHREYRVTGSLYSIATGQRVGGGVGSCSTMEKKYRYRSIDKPTDVGVPKRYWDTRSAPILAGALDEAGVSVPSDASLGTTKEDGTWVISIRERGENPDIADVYNTCLKMAKKRWLVDATLTATGASALFTQDLEDIPDFDYTPSAAPMDVAEEDAFHWSDAIPEQAAALPGDYPMKIINLNDWLASQSDHALPSALQKASDKISKWQNKDAWELASDVIEWHQTHRINAS